MTQQPMSLISRCVSRYLAIGREKEEKEKKEKEEKRGG